LVDPKLKRRTLSYANLAAVIKDMEREMREAATNLEFEKAAKLRDEVKRLREMELDVLAGAKD
jgi:excinuclease ABC subunit B